MSAEAGRENAMSLRTPPTSTNTGQAASVKIKGAPSKYVKLNVGGTLFYTTIGTLTKLDNMLRAMFSGRMEVLTDSEGKVCPQTIVHIPTSTCILKVKFVLKTIVHIPTCTLKVKCVLKTIVHIPTYCTCTRKVK